jgi:hypothetical protein
MTIVLRGEHSHITYKKIKATFWQISPNNKPAIYNMLIYKDIPPPQLKCFALPAFLPERCSLYLGMGCIIINCSMHQFKSLFCF